MNKKIALFGGTFDPIHTDHLNIIKACKEKLKFDEVWVIPTYLNPFKVIGSTSTEQRIDMINIAIQSLYYVKIIDYEINNLKKSITFDTVTYIKNKYPDFDFSFIMGSDQLDQFENWNNFDKLISCISFKVFQRNKNYNKNIIEKYNLEMFTFNNNHISSTDIRNLEKIHLQISEVNDYINDNLLYYNERIKSKMDEKRFLHCLNVGKTAHHIAQINGFDTKLAFTAGVLHDIAKRFDNKTINDYISGYDKKLLDEPEPVLHSFVGGIHLEKDWLFNNKEIINSVFNHTVGRPNMSILEIIVFCADKISSERNYDGVFELRKNVFHDLENGFKMILQSQKKQLLLKNDKIGNKFKETYEFYFGKGTF